MTLRRGARIAIVVIVVVAALLAVNAVVLDNQTKPAAATAPGGEVVELSSVDLQVVDHPATGEGPAGAPIVLLHCFACSLRWWDAVLPALNERHRLVTVDLIGHGGSEKPKSGYEITAQGAAVAEALSDLGVRGATVVGHSFGGAVATSLAESASEVADRVVLIGSASDGDAIEGTLRDRLLRAPVIGEAMWRLRIDSLVESGYSDAFAPGFDVDSGFDDPDRVTEDLAAMTYTSYEESGTALADYLDEGSLASRLTTTGAPLLVLAGSEDQIVDPDVMQSDYEAVPAARIEVIDGAGHSPQVEDPKATAAAILRFAEAGAAAGQDRGKRAR